MKKLFVLIFTLTLSLPPLANAFWKSYFEKCVDEGMRVFDKNAAKGKPIRDSFGKPKIRKKHERFIRETCSQFTDEEIRFYLEKSWRKM